MTLPLTRHCLVVIADTVDAWPRIGTVAIVNARGTWEELDEQLYKLRVNSFVVPAQWPSQAHVAVDMGADVVLVVIVAVLIAVVGLDVVIDFVVVVVVVFRVVVMGVVDPPKPAASSISVKDEPIWTR